MSVISTVVPARAGLAGHPSDAFGGAVLAAPIIEVAATVTVGPSDEVVVGERRFADLASLRASAHEGESMVLTAAVTRLASWVQEHGGALPRDGFSLTWRTTIPRSVGLAGSSALVVGALRSLARLWDVLLPDDVGPRLALEVEADLLGIAAGPQDRVVQWHASTLLMDFGVTPWSVEHVHPPAPIELFVCWTDAVRRSSDAIHRPLQRRRDEPEVREHMAALAALAHDAATALRAGDVDSLGRCMEAGFEHRRSLVTLDPAHLELVEQFRGLGAAATYAGSGGAVIALAPDVAQLREWASMQGLGSVTTSIG